LQFRSNSLVTVAHEKVGVELGQIQRDLSDPMGSIDHAQNVIFFAHLGDPLKGKANSRDRNDSLEHADLGCQTIVQDSRNRLGQGVEDLRVGTRQCIGKVLPMPDLSKLELRICLNQGDQGFLNGPIDGVKIDDTVVLLVDQITQDRIDAYAIRRGPQRSTRVVGLPVVAFSTKTHSSVGALTSWPTLSRALSNKSTY
jgi:hypothetical protein